MGISNTKAVAFALTPGAAEDFEKFTKVTGNMAFNGIAMGVKDARNALYVGVALTTIAATGAALSDDTIRQYACATVATLGAGLATLAAKRLYDVTSLLQQIINLSFPS